MTDENALRADPRPRFFAVHDPANRGLVPPSARRDVAARALVRTLAGWQKEALVVSSAGQQAWRLTSDEGPYLAGHDEAPFPLAFLTAGMVASYMNELLALAAQRGITIRDLRLTQDNHYTMEGSMIRGTLIGGALAPELSIEIDAEEDPGTLRSLGADAIAASPVNGLLRGANSSLFTLTHNQAEIRPMRAGRLDGAPLDDAEDVYDHVTVDGPAGTDVLMEKIVPARRHESVGSAGPDHSDEQKQLVHVRGVCTLRSDGAKVIDVQLLKPTGSNFRFLSEEPGEDGGMGRAPDAATLISAGIAFCFTSQLGRHAAIAKKPLDRDRIIQDTHFSYGGASGGTNRTGATDPVETHVFLDTHEDDDFARRLLDLAEQSCFLHGLCRTDLKTRMRLLPGAMPARVSES